MSTSSGTTVSSSTGLGIDLFPAEFSNISSSEFVPTSADLPHASHHSQSLCCARDNPSLFLDSDGSKTPLPSRLDLGGTVPSASTAIASWIDSQRRTNSYTDGPIDVDSKSYYHKAVPGKSIYPRQRTLLTNDGTLIRNAEELKCILGNTNARLKSGAAVNPVPFSGAGASGLGKEKLVSLEQAMSRSRVNLDIFLESDVCVQGGTMQGYIQIRVRKSLKKNCLILISGGKLGLIGFESADNELERSIFYQCSAPLSKITHGLERLYSSEPDKEGFAASAEGVHLFPFALHLAPNLERGIAKGTFSAQNGLAIRYVIMISLALKDPTSGVESIAHFYRDCCIWPRLNPSNVLAPTSRPIQVNASEFLRAGGNGEIKLAASIHRLHWISGQKCFVGIKVVNNSDKALKTASLRLMRSITVFRVGYKFDGAGNDQRNSAIADVLQASTTTKEVAQSNLELCGRGTRGHASAKGWWAGVLPGQTRSFSHQITIPPNAVSILRGNILEVSYTLQVTISVGTLLSTEVQVSLPIEILNFLSIDPPAAFIPNSISATQSVLSLDSTLKSPSYSEEDSYDEDEGYCSEDESLEHSSGLTDRDSDGIAASDAMTARPALDGTPTRHFADLYYSSLREDLDQEAENYSENWGQSEGLPASESHSQNPKNTFADRVKEKFLQRNAAAVGIGSSQWIQHSGISEGVPTDSEASLPSQLSASSSVYSGLPASSTQGGHSTSARDTEKPCSCGVVDARLKSCPKTPRGDYTTECEFETRTISDVALPEVNTQRPHWKTPNPSGPEDLAQPGIRKPLPQVPNEYLGDNLENASPAYRESDFIPTPKASRHDADIPKCISSPSAPPTGSVRERIRELELATKTADI